MLSCSGGGGGGGQGKHRVFEPTCTRNFLVEYPTAGQWVIPEKMHIHTTGSFLEFRGQRGSLDWNSEGMERYLQ